MQSVPSSAHTCAFLVPALGIPDRKFDIPDGRFHIPNRLFHIPNGPFHILISTPHLSASPAKKPYSVSPAAFGESNISLFSPRFSPYASHARMRARTHARKAYFYRNALPPFDAYIPKTLDFIKNSPYYNKNFYIKKVCENRGSVCQKRRPVCQGRGSVCQRGRPVCQRRRLVCRNETSPPPGLPRASGGERRMKGIFGKSPACSARLRLQSAEVANLTYLPPRRHACCMVPGIPPAFR